MLPTSLWKLFLLPKCPGTPLKIRLVRYLAIGFFFIFFQKSHEIFSRFGWHSSRLCVCAVVAPGLVDSGSLVTENGHRVFLWVPQQFLMPAGPCIVRRWVVQWMMERLNNYLFKLTSVFHQYGKGSVSWWLNTTNVNIMINISIGIKRWSSHETSHTSMSEIYEFRVHSTPPKIVKMNNIVFTI